MAKLRTQPGVGDLQSQHLTHHTGADRHHVGVIVLPGHPGGHHIAKQGAGPDMVIARFNPERGVVAKGDLSGEIILLSIVPSAMTYPANMEKGTATYRYANNAQVSLYLGQTQLCQRTLPIYEFGATVQLLVPKK